MKKQLTVALGLAVLATPAFATKARLEALGEDNYGSYYINDNRNMFLNPAQINNNKDLVTYEFGKTGQGNNGADSISAPKAEGGFTKGHGNMAYGLHFGNTTPNVSLIRSAAGVQEQQPVDLFVGGDAGVKWGANLTYENYDSGRQGSSDRLASNSLRTRLGAIMGDLDVFAHVSLSNEAKDFQGSQVKGDLGYMIGASYMLNNYKLIAEWRQINAEYQNADLGMTKKQDLKYNQIRIGAARQERLNDKATLFAKAMIVRQDVKDDAGFLGQNPNSMLGQGNGFTGAGDATVTTLPLTLGTEYNAASWLDLRASVSHNIWSQSETDPKNGKKASGNVANTVVRAGASLKFGEFSVDGLVSTNNDGSTAGDGSSQGANVRADQLMTRVSMIYRF